MALSLDLLTRLAVALAVGLLIGLERGWYTRDVVEGERAAGLRTFALSGLLGGIAAALSMVTGPVVLGLVFLAFAIVFTAFHWLEARADNDVGATSVVAGLVTFGMGAYAVVGDVYIAAAGAVAVTVVLALREPLHAWIAALQWQEIRSILILLAMTFLLLPILPDRTIDPWHAVNPRDIWLFAILIAAISFGGYFAVRHLGTGRGIVLAAIAGGLASSTAATLSLARFGSDRPQAAPLLSGGIVIAGIVMIGRVFVVVALLNRSLLLPLAPHLLAMAAVLALAAAAMLLRRPDAGPPEIAIRNPLELGTAFKFALLVGVVMLASKASLDVLNENAILAVAAISGIVDVDAITISMTRIAAPTLAADWRVQAIVIAVMVNTTSKALIAAWVGGREIGRRVGGASALAIAVTAASLLVV